MEPLPKQGCEAAWTKKISTLDRLSGTPAEAGVRALISDGVALFGESQWNPCRSRGASLQIVTGNALIYRSQWNPCRSRGARAFRFLRLPRGIASQWNPCRSRGARGKYPKRGRKNRRLSGTPAEAGVRGRRPNTTSTLLTSQWNPCRSRGARRLSSAKRKRTVGSQWNPCRSRGARCTHRPFSSIRRVSVEPLPKQGCETSTREINSAWKSLSGTPAEAGVREGKIQ